MLLTALIILFSFLLNFFLPWWSIALPGLVFGYFFKPKAFAAFGWGFLALFLLWGAQALYIHFANDGILSTRIAEMLQVGSPLLVVLITGVIGGLVSALATLTGALFANKPQRRRSFS
ncbi:MAG: hypothetical protein WC967_05655 [Balneolaceae bacterium]